VEAMEQVRIASQEVSTTAQQLALASGSQATMAGDLKAGVDDRPPGFRVPAAGNRRRSGPPGPVRSPPRTAAVPASEPLPALAPPPTDPADGLQRGRYPADQRLSDWPSIPRRERSQPRRFSRRLRGHGRAASPTRVSAVTITRWGD